MKRLKGKGRCDVKDMKKGRQGSRKRQREKSTLVNKKIKVGKKKRIFFSTFMSCLELLGLDQTVYLLPLSPQP